MRTFGEDLLVLDTLGIVVLLVPDDIRIEAVGGADTEPEQLKTVVQQGGIGGVLREAGIQGLGDEVCAVRSQVCELVKVGQGREEGLTAAAGESRYGAVVPVVDRTEIGLHIGHDACGKLLVEHLVHADGSHRIGPWSAVHHIAVRHHDDHRFGLALGDEVVEDNIELTYLEPGLLGVGCTADEVEHGILLAGSLITGGSVDKQWPVQVKDG